MMLVVKNTFLEWLIPCDGHVRSRSAPPECFVDRAVAEANRRELQRACEQQRRKNKSTSTKRRNYQRREAELSKQAEFDAIREYRSLAMEDLWILMAMKILRALEIQKKWVNITMKLSETATSKFRFSMSAAVYKQVAFWTCANDVSMLWTTGVFRRGKDGTVEIWSSDAVFEHTVVKVLLRESKNYTEAFQKGSFQLAMIGKATKTLKASYSLPVDALRAVASASYGVKPGAKLVHLGVELKFGSLADNGVGPGSVVLVCRDY